MFVRACGLTINIIMRRVPAIWGTPVLYVLVVLYVPEVLVVLGFTAQSTLHHKVQYATNNFAP